MIIVANGEDREIPEGATAEALLAALDLGDVRVAFELNGLIVPRERYAETPLSEGDRVEIVTFVGGG